MVAGLEEVAKQGVRLAVLPEQATIGYIFDDFAMVEPYLDTVPGKATAAISKVTRAHHMYVVVGIAERDVETGLGFNTVALIEDPWYKNQHGIIGHIAGGWSLSPILAIGSGVPLGCPARRTSRGT